MRSSSALVGRAEDRRALERRFDDEDARLVTLLGPTGIGKSALARSFGAERSAIVIALDGACDEAAACDRVLVACGVSTSDPRGGAIEQVATVLGDRGSCLVVLDDVAPALAPFVGALLERSPEVALLVTARERLGCDDEIVHELGPLDVAGGEAVEVLVAAARRASHAWSPRPEDLHHLVAIARALEGIPLALELAGARLPIVGAAVLSRDGASPLSRAATIAVSALPPPEREALASLAAFRSGFTVASASAVLAVDALEAARVVECLRARSLVRTRDASSARFDLYEPIRAAVASADPGALARARERHAAWFVERAETAALRAHHDPEARSFLVAERDELMSIVEQATTSAHPSAREAEPALRAIVASTSVLLARGPMEAIAAIVSPLVERTRDSGADPRLSARVTALRGALRRERGDVRAALKDLLAADSIARALSDEALAADVLVELGRTVLAAGEVAAARDHFDRAARAYAVLGARGSEAYATALLGATSGVLGDVKIARAMLERADALASGDRFARPAVLVLLARACAEGGDDRAALAALDEAIGVASVERDVRAHGEALVLRGVVLARAGELDRAAEALASARDLFLTNGLATDAAIARGWLGVVARARARAAEAYALLADARDACRRGARPAHAVAFGVFLAALDMDVGRDDAAVAALDALATEAEAAYEHASAWPPSATVLVGLARGEATASASLHASLLSLRAASAAVAPAPDDALLVAEGGSWFRLPHGERVGLERRRSLALLLDRLASSPGRSVDARALFEAAWPGERAIASAAAHRVRVAVATLRKLGLRELLVTNVDGYALSAQARVVRV